VKHYVRPSSFQARLQFFKVFVILCIIYMSYALSDKQQTYLQNSQHKMVEIDIHKTLNNTSVNNLCYYNLYFNIYFLVLKAVISRWLWASAKVAFGYNVRFLLLIKTDSRYYFCFSIVQTRHHRHKEDILPTAYHKCFLVINRLTSKPRVVLWK
jgi:hypothetical protein